MAIKIVIKTTAILLLLFLIQCKQQKNPENKKNIYQSNDWVKDSIGCLHLRTKVLALKLINENKLMNDTKKKFLDVFKSPNNVENTKEAEILEYYMGNFCENAKPVANSDKCYAKFYFKEGKLAEMHFICE